MRTVKVHASLRKCAASPEHSLFKHEIYSHERRRAWDLVLIMSEHSHLSGQK